MKTLIKITAAALTGALLTLSAPTAFADGRGHGGGHHHHDRGWDRHDHGWNDRGHHHRHHHYRGPAVVYSPYYAPPAVMVPQGFYAPRPAPAVTIGISPITIPLYR